MTSRHTLRTIGAAIALVVAIVGLSGCIVTPGDPGPADVTFTINMTTGVKAISPLIYGSNSNRGLATNHQTMLRQGGNRWTAYNWENNASNAGSDYCFQNDGFLSSSNTAGAAVTPTINQATAAGAAALVTVPIVDYVSADKNGGCDVRNSGANYLQTRFKQNKPTKGSAFAATPNSTDAFVYEDEYVNWLKANEAGANLIFSLDNEPDLWSSTHAEVHPAALTYAEIVQRNVDYAKAIKAVMPNVKVSGPVNYGFAGFENLQGAPDANGRNFLDFYLDQMKAADTAAGKRLVDYLDLHWYPEATGGGVRITGTDTTAAVVAAREQAPRSLWDPTYVENSWISNAGNYNYGAIKLIPRTLARITAHDPGAQMAITEWNYGGGDHISGGIASADVLGTFGRQGLGMASLWELNGNESYTYAAFRAYRNYDGAGSTFGDTSVDATSSDVATAAVYASRFAATPNKGVIVAINKANTAKTAAIKITCGVAYHSAKVYTITAGGGATLVAQPTINTAAANAFNYSMPAQSVSVIVPQ